MTVQNASKSSITQQLRSDPGQLIWLAKAIQLVCLKLVLTNLNYRVLRTSTVAIFLSYDLPLYTSICLGYTSCLISFVLDQSTCQKRVEGDKIQNEKKKQFLPTVGLKPTQLRFAVWCSTDWAMRAIMNPVSFKWPLYIHMLPIPMYILV